MNAEQPATHYRQRPLEAEAIQWTGTNPDQLRTFAGGHFDTVEPQDRIEDPDQDAQLLIEASHWVGIKSSDWVLKFEGYFVAKADAAFRAVWEPAVSSSAPADRAELRDRIRALALLEAADFLRDAHFRDGLSVQEIGTALRHTADTADPMVGSLARDGFGLDEIAAMPDTAAPPAPVDRATVLHQTERDMLAYALDLAQDQMHSRSGEFTAEDQEAVDALRRLAGEARDERETQADPDPLVDELPCCSDPTCACDEVDAAGRCGCTKWDSAPADETQQPEAQASDGDRIVAYQSPGGTALFCTRHRDELSPYWPPVFSEDLPDGGICAHSTCGADLLIPQQPEAAEGAQQ